MDTTNRIVVLPAPPLLNTGLAHHANCNASGSVQTYAVVRMDGPAAHMSLDGVLRLLPSVQCTFLGLLGAACPEFLHSTGQLAVNEEFQLTIRDVDGLHWRVPTGAFLPTVRPILAEAEHQFLTTSPVHLLNDQQLSRRNALDAARGTAMQLATLTAMQANQRDLQAALPVASSVTTVESMRINSNSQQLILAKVDPMRPLFDNDGMFNALFYPILHGQPAPLLVPFPPPGVEPAARLRSPFASFDFARELVDSTMREVDMASLHRYPPLSGSKKMAIAQWDWTELSIADLFPTGSAFAFVELLLIAFGRLVPYVLKAFGTQLATGLQLLLDGTIRLHHRFTVKLPASTMIIFIDRQLEDIRALSRRGPDSCGLSYFAWLQSKVCAVTSQTPFIRDTLDSYASPVAVRVEKKVEKKVSNAKLDRGGRGARGGGRGGGGRGGGGSVVGNGAGNAPSPSSTKGGRTPPPPTPSGASAVCNNWLRNKGVCRNQVACKNTSTARAHNFAGWSPLEEAAYRQWAEDTST
jgi:uncharacterized membrane protein YgcG